MPKATTVNGRAGWCLVTGANDNDVKVPFPGCGYVSLLFIDVGVVQVWDIDSPRGHVSTEEWAFGEGGSSHGMPVSTVLMYADELAS